MSVNPDLTCGAINANLFGKDYSSRLVDYQVHPFIRNNWQSSDRLRDVFGYVPVIVSVNEGATNVVVENISETLFHSAPFDDVGTGDMTLDVALQAHLLLEPAGSHSQHKFHVHFNENSWNTIAQTPELVNINYRANMIDFLNKESVAPEYAGVPYFVRYFAPSDEGLRTGLLTTDPRMAGSDQNVNPIMTDEQMLLEMSDHCFEYYMYDPSRPDSTYDIEINSVYNYFLDSDPDYESVIAPAAVPESLLPNYYMIEVNQSTASLPYLAETNFNGMYAVQNDTVSSFFTGQPQWSLSQQQAISQGYLQYYAATVSDAEDVFSSAGGLQGVADEYKSKYKNIAVLTPEIAGDFLQDFNLIEIDDRGTENDPTDDLLAIANYPYYNEIIIPHDNQHQDVPSNSDFFDTLVSKGATESQAIQFLTLIQLYITYKYSNTSSRTFTTYDKTAQSNRGYDIIEENKALGVAFDLEEFIQQLTYNPTPITNSQTWNECFLLANFYDTGRSTWNQAWASNWDMPDFVPLRPAFAEELRVFEGGAVMNQQGFPLTLLAAASAITEIVRETPEFWTGLIPGSVQGSQTYAPSESLMYVVEKRVVPAGQLVANPSTDPVQTLFFGKDYTSANKKGIRYIDTQIKYGVKYQYDIKQIRLVFGNKYEYGNQTRSLVNVPSFGRAVGNALGFFAPERNAGSTWHSTDQYVVDDTTLTAERILDKTGIADEANPKLVPIPPNIPTWANLPEHLRPTYIPSQFRWLEEDGELLPARASRGFYGYYVYRIKQQAHDMFYRTVDMFAAGALTRNSPNAVDASIDLNLLMIELRPGAGFNGNPSGGAIPGTHPQVRYDDSSGTPTPESPPDERPGGPDGGDEEGPKGDDGPGSGGTQNDDIFESDDDEGNEESGVTPGDDPWGQN